MRIPPFHWWRTVFFLIPAIAVYTIVLGTLSIASSFVRPARVLRARCARAWSWLILTTTGVDVDVRGLERLTPGTTYIFVSNHQSIYDIPIIFWNAAVPAADHREGVARTVPVPRLAPAAGPGTCSSIGGIPTRSAS